MSVRPWLAAALAAWMGCALAQQPGALPNEAEQKAAFEAAEKAARRGPVQIPLGNQGTLDLSPDFSFIPQPEAGRLMSAMGNSSERDLLGVVTPSGDEGDWFATIRFIKSGYVRDDDAKNWDVDGLLESLRDGTEEGNRDRTARGFPAIEVKGWIEKPVYDPQSRRLVWSALAVEKASPDEGSVNYNTYALGREGYLSLNLVTTPAKIQDEKRHALTLLSSLNYLPGKRYEDFNEATDHVAEYGLAALVAGAAAKKLGLFAVVGVAVAKFGKVILVGALALGAAVMKLFRRRSGPGGAA